LKPHLADSEYIVGHYRHVPGFWASLRSLFRLHNETANIYTHASGFVMCSWLLLGVLSSPEAVGLPPAPTTTAPALLPAPCAGAPLWPLAVFLCGALVCLGASVAFHAFAPVSVRAFNALAKADYAGISALIFSSMVPPLVYAFWDDAHALRAYLALAAATNSAAAAAGTMDAFRSPAWRWARAGAFIACGVVGGLPLFHSLWRSGLPTAAPMEREAAWRAVYGTALMGAQYVVGAVLYAARVPERWAPGRYDLFGSHAVFHILVVTAVWTHWTTAAALFEWRDNALREACA
jgi:adiponectin receptor